MKKKLLLFLLFSTIAIAQNPAWKIVDYEKIEPKEIFTKAELPKKFTLFEFDYETFVSNLNQVPKRDYFTGTSNVIVSIPNPKGELINYRIVEASSFDEILQARFPNIRSFAGQEVNNPSNIIRFSLSRERGLSAIIRSTEEQTTFIIDPITTSYKYFIVFDRKESAGKSGSFDCSTIDEVKQFGPVIERSGQSILNNADDSTLRRFRLAQSCTAEYSNAFGATSSAQVNLVLAAYNNTITRVNGIYEQDFNVTLQIINESTNVIYYNAATDPYSDGATGSGGAWNAELQNNLSANLTGTGTSLASNNAVYDVGHLFGASGGGGNAGCIGCVCVNDTASTTDENKGSGFTSPGSGLPQGDTFDIDYVAHELGHQFGGNHTFTTSTENNSVNVEPGSGVTIMGYAGITGGNTDVARNSIAVFHAASIQQITNNVKGKTCQTNITISNAVPVPSAPGTMTLPIGTAFKLTGTATDANTTDVLSYSWEQIDDATTSANLCDQSNTSAGDSDCIPVASNTAGPNFRSYLPSNSGTRYFPRIQDHVRNGLTGNKWEVVTNVARTMNFRFTVRDNKLGGGNNESVNTAVTFDATKGPFLITSQNTSGINYTEGSTQTVTWSVNNTNTMTGASNVNIKLSTDGGLTFPITLAANTANDGTQAVNLPTGTTAPFCRILIEPTGNNFYAINTTDFAIGYSVQSICNTYTATPNATIIEQSPLAYQNFTLNIPTNVLISDVNVISDITHRVKQLYVGVNHPDGTFVQLFQGDATSCANNSSPLNCTFDDAGVNYVCGGSATYKPVGTLSSFNGKNSQGNWRFRVADTETVGNPSANQGTLNSFSIQVCSLQITETPVACGTIITTWNGSAWSNGSPTKNIAAIFNGNYNSTSDLSACSVTINSGFLVTFNSGHTLTVGKDLTVTGTGSLVINNNAALVQIDKTAVNTGNIVVKRSSAPMIRLDYTAWSSPVTGQNIKNFSPNTLDNRFYEYLYTGTTTPTAYQSVANVTTTNFAVAKGYMIRSANDWPTTATAYNGQFTGVARNGDYTIGVGRGYNLLGNPYPSPIDANRFLDDNNTTAGALYFWTHTVAAVSGTYPQNNYATYTKLGGVAAAAGGAVPNGKIQTGQGFFVNSLEYGTAQFNNAQRLNASSSTQFFRTNETTNSNDSHRVWINLQQENNEVNQIMIGYTAMGSANYDLSFDGELLNPSQTSLYSFANNKKYAIQAKSLPFTDEDIIPIGLNATSTGNYSIGYDHSDGLLENQTIFLKDKLTNTIHNLRESNYSFNTESGIIENRFEIVFKYSILSQEILNNLTTQIYSNNQIIHIKSNQNVNEVEVYDALGRILYTKKDLNQSSFEINTITTTNQALIVKVKTIDGQISSQKVMF